MKLTTIEILALFKALSDLQGAPTLTVNQRGQREVVHEPYDMGPKFKWNAAKDRSILRRLVDDHDEQAYTFQAGLKKLRRELSVGDDPKENQRKLQEATDEVNEQLRQLSKKEFEVEGLLYLPASGLNIKTSRIPPTVIEELMPLIEGEPDFEPEKEPAKKGG